MTLDEAIALVNSASQGKEPAAAPSAPISAPQGAADRALAILGGAPPAAGSPPPQGSGIGANLGAGANEYLAGTLGLPADVATSGINQLQGLQRGLNAALPPSLQRYAQPPRAPITAPVGGSESIMSGLGAIGADPRNVQAVTPEEQGARAVGSSIPAAVTPYLGARAMIERGATGLFPRLFGGPAPAGQNAAQTALGAAGAATTGAGGAVAGEAAQNFLPPDSPLRGTANLAGNLAVGGVLSMAPRAAARMIQPLTNPNVGLLQSLGVTPTIGQIIGGVARDAEEKATSLPIVGNAIQAARARAETDLNRGVTNRALEPIGERLDPGTAIGRDSIDEMWEKSGDAYRAAVPQSGMFIPPRTQSEMNNLVQMAQTLPDDYRRQFNNYLQTHLVSRISNTGHISGEELKAADSALGEAVRDWNTPTSTPRDRQLANAFREAQRIMRDGLADVNPQVAAEVRAADAAHAMALRVGDASRRADQSAGQFTPAQLQAGVKKYATERQYQRGEGLLQDVADAGRDVLGRRVPDSGTAGRGLLPYAIVAALSDPVTAAKYGLGLGAAAGLYSPLGQRATAALLTRRPAWAAPVADYTRALAPGASAAASYPLWELLRP